jgi:Flp pilus assembly protein TadG
MEEPHRMLNKVTSAVFSIARSFSASNSGNVAVIFALIAVPLIVAMGGTVDYTRGARARGDMQDAIDATSLALARQADIGTMTPTELQQSALNLFRANFSNPEAQGLVLTSAFSADGPTVTVNASASVPTYFLGLIGLHTIPLGVSAETTWGQALLRVSLVLDNTGSMAQSGKMDALKTATHSLLAQMKKAASKDGDVYVSIVPFSKDINVGPASYNQSWVRWDLWDAVNGTCSQTSYSTKTSCVSHYNVWTANDHSTWNGCITDRDQNYDTNNVAPVAGTPATLFPAEQYSNCPTQLTGLTYDWTALNNLVDAMQPNGNTNQAIGLQWGWQSLTSAPFTIPPTDPARKYKQIIILLTDGLNTQDRWYTSQSQIDTRESIACNAIKAANVLVYTVQVNTGNDPTSTMLKNCASDSGAFFLLTSADQIIATFQKIGTEISDLRVAS